MDNGAIEMIVRRRLERLMHSMYDAPAVSRRHSSNVRTMAAMRFSIECSEYPNFLSDCFALASLLRLMSQNGDLGCVSHMQS